MGLIQASAPYTHADCDDSTCSAQLDLTDLGVHWRHQADEALRKAGWQLWVGRGHRTYCPDHGPRPGHKMRQVV